jgi:hypothetical protein
MTRFIFICSALVVVCAGAALAAGNYQHTKDGKIIVWNDDPQPGDAAVWFGDRDKENYATGVGTLTWYQASGGVYARYHGNMVHGKFDGAVNVYAKRKTGHATFANGKRTSRWLPGPAASRAAPDWRAGPDARVTAKASAKKEPKSEPAAIVAHARPRESSTAPAKQKVAKQENAEQKTSNAERPTPNVQHSIEDIPAEGPSAETTTSLVGKKDTPPVNGSADRATESKPEIGDLLAPPSALREDPIVETPSTAEPEKATSPSANAQLTAEEALNLADTEARAQGYDLDQYQRTNADYSQVKKKWSLSYDLKQADAADENAPHFRVSVDDETRKAEIQQ